MNPTKDNTELDNVAQQSHEEWLRHPMTAQLIKNLKKHRETTIVSISRNSANADQLIILASNLANTDAIALMITNFQLFHNLTKS